jgi:predicted Fe-S protein YdhL (DUF1289 family)
MKQIASPCVNICTLDVAGTICLGGGRSREEIGTWMIMSEQERDAIIQRLAERKSETRA